jgi:hypothetical protein
MTDPSSESFTLSECILIKSPKNIFTQEQAKTIEDDCEFEDLGILLYNGISPHFFLQIITKIVEVSPGQLEIVDGELKFIAARKFHLKYAQYLKKIVKSKTTLPDLQDFDSNLSQHLKNERLWLPCDETEWRELGFLKRNEAEKCLIPLIFTKKDCEKWMTGEHGLLTTMKTVIEKAKNRLNSMEQ